MDESGTETRSGGLSRKQLEMLVAEGLTIREMSEQLGRCSATVKKWLGRYGLKTQRASQRGQGWDTASVVRRPCRHHGRTEFARGVDGYYRCRQCRVDSVVKRRRRLKEILAREAGGRCVLCGYSRYLGALQFHHLDPTEKSLGLARGGLTLSVETLPAEAAKCVLLCSNCQAEVEAGLETVPIQ